MSSGKDPELPHGLVGNYQIVSMLGAGGMGAVYLARHTLLGRPAAVKVLLPEMSQNHDVVNRFFNEARAATAIRHPSIVEIYDFGFLPQGNAYIIMELLDGESLSRRIARVGAMPAAAALLLARQIAGALLAAHQMQIVHRDLKPDNVFVVRDPEIVGGERIKLLDFGIAKLASQAGENKTQTGTVMGTPTYMSPEQCRGAGNVDRRADLYALGCMLYELLCGRPPFLVEGAGEVIARHLYFAPEPPRRHQPGVPDAVEQLVMWLLQKDPAARPDGAGEVIAAIDRLNLDAPQMKKAPSGAHPVAPGATPTTTLGSFARARSNAETAMVRGGFRRARASAAGVVALSGGLLWGILASRGGEDGASRRPAARPPPSRGAPAVETAGQPVMSAPPSRAEQAAFPREAPPPAAQAPSMPAAASAASMTSAPPAASAPPPAKGAAPRPKSGPPGKRAVANPAQPRPLVKPSPPPVVPKSPAAPTTAPAAAKPSAPPTANGGVNPFD